jgi:hypothetical protein
MTAVSLKRLFPALACLLLSAGFAPDASAQSAAAAYTYDLPPATPGEYNGDVRHLPPVYTPRPYLLLNEFEGPSNHKPKGVAPEGPHGPQNLALAPMPSATTFAGLGFGTSVTGGTAGSGWPPDTNGDVGPTVYIQSVNSAFGIFDKSTGSSLAAFTENQLWSASTGPSNPCKTDNDGDPVVLHDAINDRWILTDFAFAFDVSNNPIAPFYECIAVSKTNDPVAGGWWFYALQMDTGSVPSNTLADYPKFGLWGDGCLYMGANGFDNSSGNYAGAIFASFNTTNMYAGASLTSSVGFLAADANGEPFGMFPANALGTTAASMPPSGTPEYFVNESSTTFAWIVRTFTKGTNCGGGGVLASPTSVTQGTYGYPAINPGSGYTVDMVPQKSTTNKLDSLGDRMMQKVQYRKIGSAESLWVVHTTCGSAHDANFACANTSSATQPQWAQIDVTNKTIATTPVQEQIYAPDTTMYRWMGSLAVDASGDMAVGYSTSNGSNFPGIAYSGRLVGDPASTLPQTETVLQAGSGSQALKISGNFVPRWGDYSAMSVDPSDDCTFWYTNEYYDSVSHGNSGTWQTRIGSFKFPSCTSTAPAKLVFTQEPNSSYTSNTTITVKVSVEDASNNVVTTDTSLITVALQNGTAGAVLGGTKQVNAVAGVATFSLSVDLVGSGYTLHATDGSLTAADSTGFSIAAGTASKLKFTTQPPASTQAGTSFGAVVKIQDAAGNTVTTDNSGVLLTLNGGTCANLTGNLIAATSGVATFAGIKVATAGTGCTLQATDSSLTPDTSSAFNITVGPPASIAFTTQPSSGQNIQSGALIPIVAQVQDSQGNAIVGDNVTLAIGTNAGSGTLSVTTNPVATDSSGNATFSNVSLDKVGIGYTLTVTEATGAHNATSNSFNIIPGLPTSIVFTTQPTDVTQGGTLSAIAVTEQDAAGNTIVADSATSVDFTVQACGNPVDLGSTTMNTGVATLSSAQVFNTLHPGYQISANDATLSLSALSQTFAVGPGDLIFDGSFENCSL